MPLTGQAKTDYQREYMRKRRSNNVTLDPVRPATPPADAQIDPRLEKMYLDNLPKPQSHSPMMVGYVPPKE